MTFATEYFDIIIKVTTFSFFFYLYVDMIRAALESLKERGGSSRQAILKYIMANFKVGNDVNSINVHLKMALKNGAHPKYFKYRYIEALLVFI